MRRVHPVLGQHVAHQTLFRVTKDSLIVTIVMYLEGSASNKKHGFHIDACGAFACGLAFSEGAIPETTRDAVTCAFPFSL